MPPKKEETPVQPPAEEVPDVPREGYGKFEYVNQTLYVGEWKLLDREDKPSIKVKHGRGKIIFAGANTPTGAQVGTEYYDGSWENDEMHGEGTYAYTSGNTYTGQWVHGVMEGFGKMVYADGSTYEGHWKNNLMHGEGVYLDADQINWQGIFVDGQYDSKIQKKLQGEKLIKDKIIQFEAKASDFVEQFTETFAKSDKKTFKENLTPFFGNTETCVDFVNLDAFPKFEDKPADKWNELIKGMTAEEGATHRFKALSVKDDGTLITADHILVDQLKSKPGGQLVECLPLSEDGGPKLVLCELPSEQWVIVYYAE